MKKCSICIHQQKHKIDMALLLSHMSLRDIGGQFHVSKSALGRHQAYHIPSDLVKSKKANEVVRADSLIDQLFNLKRNAQRVTLTAESDGDLKTALSGIREQSRIIEILAKMQGEIQQPVLDLTVNNFELYKIYNRLSRKFGFRDL
jgi:hypothetical protein